jgi:2-polyprenyl-3-methyl-5-hydroxy-6-metoxy-1,4-benzoquinol methylase
MSDERDKTTTEYWSDIYTRQPRMRLPSGYFIGTLNLMRLLRLYVKPGMAFLEVGCAPGKMLAWVAEKLHANVSGIDYSTNGIDSSKKLFSALGISSDLRCEDFFATTFQSESFDVVYSAGVIEHFNDPTAAVLKHLQLCKPGGVAIIAVPNYGGIYGSLQKVLDPENLSIHNLKVLSSTGLQSAIPAIPDLKIRVFPFGSISPGILHFEKRIPPLIAKVIFWGMNTVGLLQPVTISALCPLLVLEIAHARG